ncbi:MAG: sulfatase, partial [Acidobacteria bacterium]
GGQMQPIAARQWSAGILPSRFQGVRFNSVGDPVLYITNPRGVSRDMQKDSIDTINALNAFGDRTLHDPEIQTRIAQYEMAFRMQTSVPGLLDMSSEPSDILEMYGAKPGDGSFASNCLLARRLAERGVRFIQLYHRDWDHHSDVKNNLVFKAQEVDKATAALILDLKQRGMLDDTLVIWGGEFGRTPMSQGRGGRDHHIKGFSFMVAGGGIKRGLAYGATDDLGYAAVEHPVSVHDFHATMLYLLGIDATKLAVKYQGLDVRLIGPEGGSVVRDIIA